MTSQPAHSGQRNRRSGVAIPVAVICLAAAACLALAACGGASAPSPSAPAAVAAAPSQDAGPTSFATWIDHLGFGASIGPNEVRRSARYISEHSGNESLFELDGDIALVTDLIAWMDSHPATACWADYHAAVRASLLTVQEGWTAARPTVEKGGLIPMPIVRKVSDAANAANDLPAPTNCP